MQGRQRDRLPAEDGQIPWPEGDEEAREGEPTGHGRVEGKDSHLGTCGCLVAGMIIVGVLLLWMFFQFTEWIAHRGGY